MSEARVVRPNADAARRLLRKKKPKMPWPNAVKNQRIALEATMAKAS
jgi:hypothetical protein